MAISIEWKTDIRIALESFPIRFRGQVSTHNC